MLYAYEIDGLSADDQPWATKGRVSCPEEDFKEIYEHAMRHAFWQLHYKQPYHITRVLITEVKQ